MVYSDRPTCNCGYILCLITNIGSVTIRRGSNPSTQDSFSPTADEIKAVTGKGFFEMEQALLLTVLKVTVS
jgi:hypothetical protein